MSFKSIILIVLIFYSVFIENFKFNEYNSNLEDNKRNCFKWFCGDHSYGGEPESDTTEKADAEQKTQTTTTVEPMVGNTIFDVNKTTVEPIFGNSSLYDNKTLICFRGVCFESPPAPDTNSSTLPVPNKCESIITSYHQMSYDKCCQYFPKPLNQCVFWCKFFKQSLEMISVNTSETVFPTPIPYPLPWPTVADPISWSTESDQESGSTIEPTEPYSQVDGQDKLIGTNATIIADYENITENNEPDLTPHKCDAILNDYHQLIYNTCCHSYRKHMNRCVFWCKFLNESLELISTKTLDKRQPTVAVVSNPVVLLIISDALSLSANPEKRSHASDSSEALTTNTTLDKYDNN